MTLYNKGLLFCEKDPDLPIPLACLSLPEMGAVSKSKGFLKTEIPASMDKDWVSLQRLF